MNFVVTHKLSLENLSDVLCSAFEGGSNYWYWIEKCREPSSWDFRSDLGGPYVQDYPLNPNGAVFLSDMEDSSLGVMCLDAGTLQKGLTVMAEKYPVHFADILSENSDAVTGDVLLQCCLFGEVVYG